MLPTVQPEVVIKELKRNGAFDAKRDEIFSSVVESVQFVLILQELKNKIQEATNKVIDSILDKETSSEKLALQRKVLQNVLNDETIKGLFEELKASVIAKSDNIKWAEAAVDKVTKMLENPLVELKPENNGADLSAPAVESPAETKMAEVDQVQQNANEAIAPEQVQELKQNLVAQLVEIVTEAKQTVTTKPPKPTPKRKKADDFEVSVSESSHPLVGKNLAALTAEGAYIIAKVMRYDQKENRFLVKDPYSRSQKLFEPSEMVDYAEIKYSKDNLTVGQRVQCLYPLGEGDYTTMFYPAKVVSLENDGLKVEYEDGNEQRDLKYEHVFLESDRLKLEQNGSSSPSKKQKTEEQIELVVEETKVPGSPSKAPASPTKSAPVSPAKVAPTSPAKAAPVSPAKEALTSPAKVTPVSPAKAPASPAKVEPVSPTKAAPVSPVKAPSSPVKASVSPSKEAPKNENSEAAAEIALTVQETPAVNEPLH